MNSEGKARDESETTSTSNPNQNIISSRNPTQNSSQPLLRRPLVKDYLASSSSSSNHSSTEEDTDAEEKRREQDQIRAGGYGLKQQREFEKKLPPKSSLKKLALDPFGKFNQETRSVEKTYNLINKGTSSKKKLVVESSDKGRGKQREVEPITPASKSKQIKTNSNSLLSIRTSHKTLDSTSTGSTSKSLNDMRKSFSFSEPSPRPTTSLNSLIKPIKETPPQTSKSNLEINKTNTSSNIKTKLSAFSSSHGLDLSPIKNRKTLPLSHGRFSLGNQSDLSILRGPESEATDELWMRSKNSNDHYTSNDKGTKKRSREDDEEGEADEEGSKSSEKKRGVRDVLDIGSWALARSPSQRDGKSKWIKNGLASRASAIINRSRTDWTMFEHEQSRFHLKINSPSRLRSGNQNFFNKKQTSIFSSNTSKENRSVVKPPSPHHVLKILKILPVNSSFESLLRSSEVESFQKNKNHTFSPSRAKPSQVLTICLEEEQTDELDTYADRKLNPDSRSPDSYFESNPSSSSTSTSTSTSVSSSASQMVPSIFKSLIFVLFSSSSSSNGRSGSKSAFVILDKILGSVNQNQNQNQNQDVSTTDKSANDVDSSNDSQLRIGVWDPLEIEGIEMNHISKSLFESLEIDYTNLGLEANLDKVPCLICSKYILL